VVGGCGRVSGRRPDWVGRMASLVIK